MQRGKWIIGLAALGIAALGLAWIDVLPGGWTLRGWVKPHAERRAEAQALYSAERLALFEETNRTAEAGSIVFLGSSTIERFPLATLFPGKPCLDRGIGDETATELLARVPASLPDTRPAGVVLYAASLDFRREVQAPDTVARRVAKIVRAIHGHWAGTPIALIGILPERDMPPEMVARLAATNLELASLAEQFELAFVSTARPPITTETGSLNPACAADHLHLTPAGYEPLARWLQEDGGKVGALLRP